MARVTILVPTAPAPVDDPGPGPDAGPLAGTVVGIRHDFAWRSFDWVTEEWTALLRQHGAEVRTWQAGGRTGEEGERTTAELAEFASSVDLAVVGLGN